MFNHTLYPFIVISMIGGLLTLLSSVGIFISLIIQRKVERLQAILEEFIDLSYQSDLNLSGKMFNLIEKYQMHYILPANPRRIIMGYMNITIGLTAAFWLSLYFLSFEGPFRWISILYLLPLVALTLIMFWFRKLLKYVINIENTPLLGAIIPAPKRLRSISYLSSFINVSVKSVLKQARLSLLLKKYGEENNEPWTVVLKEELSFDDFFYFVICSTEKDTVFVSFGEIIFDFPNDAITGKPSPIKKNLNIPLGEAVMNVEPEELKAHILIFTRGEKHPINYLFKLKKGGKNYYAPADNPEVTIDHQITYCIEDNKIILLKNESPLPFIKEFAHLFNLNGIRLYLGEISQGKTVDKNLKTSTESVFVD
ncbi:MAG: hypothetical protein GXW85_05665 [Clostridia bacterium]|nr:hypothetical protein [Clostridia bacterium]